MVLKVLSWNTLEFEGPWSEEWGCPLEIQRRNELLRVMKHSSTSEAAAEEVLTKERFQRIRQAVWDDTRSHGKNRNGVVDLMLFQEVSRDHPWNNPAEFDIPLPFEKVACQEEVARVDDNDDDDGKNYSSSSLPSTIQQIYVNSNSGLKAINSHMLSSDGLLEGGCLVEFSYEDSDALSSTTTTRKIYVANIHGRASVIRNPNKRAEAFRDFTSELSQLVSANSSPSSSKSKVEDEDWQDSLLICGDWNVHLSNIPRYLGFNHTTTTKHSNSVSPSFSVGMLENSTTGSMFSTNHEAGFLAQYDGCLLGSKLNVVEVSRNLTGFMPKGIDGNLWGLFSVQDSDGNVYYNQTMLPNTHPTIGLSDHLRIYTTIDIVGSGDDTEHHEGYKKHIRQGNVGSALSKRASPVPTRIGTTSPTAQFTASTTSVAPRKNTSRKTQALVAMLLMTTTFGSLNLL